MRFIASIFLLLLTLSPISFAQESSFKPVAGDVALEVNVAPFSSSPIDINRLQFRMFKPDNTVFRAGVLLNGEINNVSEDQTLSTFEIQLNLGGEKHFPGTDRLSPYLGGEAIIGLKTSKNKVDGQNQDTEITGAWSENGQERGFTQLGGNFLLGADYYVTKRIYLGIEVGYGLFYTKTADIEADPSYFDKIDGGSRIQMGATYNNAFRLGFQF